MQMRIDCILCILEKASARAALEGGEEEKGFLFSGGKIHITSIAILFYSSFIYEFDLSGKCPSFD